MIIKVIFALVGVVALMGAISFVLKYFHQKGMASKWWNGNYLKLIDTLHISSKQKVVLVSCDGVNHLLLIGSQNESVIQSGFSLSKLDKPLQDLGI